MNGKQIAELAVDLTTGAVTADFIKQMYGDGVLSSVLAITGGVGASVLANSVLDVVERETGIVSDVGSLIDDVFDLF